MRSTGSPRVGGGRWRIDATAKPGRTPLILLAGALPHASGEVDEATHLGPMDRAYRSVLLEVPTAVRDAERVGLN